ncbi:MAG: SOS response-associated peptidase [Pseudomonadota bacterium]
MCGRFALTYSWEEMVDWFNLIPTRLADGSPPPADMPPRYNIAPTQPIMMVIASELPDTDEGERARQALLVRWGLVPRWVKDPKTFTLLINARSETAATKPSFRAAMAHRRTLIPATGFYEWRRTGKGKDRQSQAFWVRPKDGGVVAFGGLMETWISSDGSEIDTGCILTTDANPTFAGIHNRLPMVVPPGDFDRWLDCKNELPADIADLLVPANDDFFEAIPVSDKVNKVANAGPDIQQPVEDRGPAKPKKEERDEPGDDGQMSLL